MDGSISAEEFSRLYEMLKAGYEDSDLDPVLEKAFSDSRFAIHSSTDDQNEVLAAIHARIDPGVEKGAASMTSIPIWRNKWVAAAAILGLLIGTAYLYRTTSAHKGQKFAVAGNSFFDAAPGRNGAILTLANGRQVMLDTVENGPLQRDGNTGLRKSEGAVSYQYQSPGAATKGLYNTVSTPRGRQFHVTLSDGTVVWLNAASSIRFPISFTGKERRIFIRGEAWLDVSPSKNAPFVVQLSHGEIQVLGTHFDVSDYEDEDNIKATLVQGSIKLANVDETILLTPGQQGRIDRKTGKISSQNADTSAVTAWTRGRIDIDGDFASLMRQISRWYDVDVIYQGKVPNIRIGGVIHRDINLSAVLEYLGQNGLHYSIKEKSIVISP